MFSLITGANGFIGSHLTRFLIEQGEQVRVLVRPQSDVRSLKGFRLSSLTQICETPLPFPD